MNLLSKAGVAVWLMVCLAISSTVHAEQKQRFDNYDVHYSVLNTTFLSPKVASAYKITRAKDKALVNIAVRKILPDDSDIAQKVIITGSSSDLMRSAPLEFTEIIEQDSVYYIAELKFYNMEIRNFTIKVQPDPGKAPYTLKFSKTLYRDR